MAAVAAAVAAVAAAAVVVVVALASRRLTVHVRIDEYSFVFCVFSRVTCVDVFICR